MQLDSSTLTDGLAAYGSPDDPLMPVGELARLLDLDLTVSPAKGQILGRVGENQRAVTVDLDNMQARVGPKVVPLAPEDVAVTPSEIYLRASALQRLLPITLQIDTSALQITIKALEILPIQARQQRIAKERAAESKPELEDQVMKVAWPYRLWSMPAFDIQLETGVDTTTAQKYGGKYDIRTAADFALTGFQGYLGSDNSGKPAALRMTFERHQLEGGLLGPIDATRFEAGDTYTPNLPIGASSGSGRGFSFSTAPLQQTSVFDRIDLRGELPIGYDVELYVNDVLRSAQHSPVQGRYEFLGVPLVRGVNVIRIVSYGPHGERSETTRVVNVSGGQVKKHQLIFEFGAIQDNTSLVTVQPPDPTTLTTGSGQVRAVANVAYGVTNNITAVAGAAMYPVKAKDEREVVSAGFRGSIMGMATQLDVARDSEGGTGLAFGVAGNPKGVSVVARHAEYQGGFIDQANGASDTTRPLVRHSELRIDGTPGLMGLAVPVSLHAQRDEYKDGAVTWAAGAMSSASVLNILMSGGLNYQRIETPGAPPQDALTGTITGSKFAGYKWQLRGTVDYSVLPDLRLDDFSFTADRLLTDRLAIRLALGQSLSGSKQTSMSASATYHSRFGDLSLNGAFTAPNDTWSIGMQLSFGLVFDPGTGRYLLTRSGPASGGSVAFRAFIDHDNDGKFGPGDEPTAKVVVNGGIRQLVTGPDGRAFVIGMGASPVARLEIAMDNVDNPFLAAPPKIVEFSPRAGQVIIVPYPLSPMGEVGATVTIDRDGKKMGLSAVRLRAVRPGSAPIEATTEFDGTVLIEHVPPGDYQLELDPEQAARLHMRLKAPIHFKVRADGGYVPDLKAEVVFDTPADAAAPPADKPADAPKVQAQD